VTGILIRALRNDIFPGMLAASGDADRIDVLRCLLRITAARIGLALNLPDIPQVAQDYGIARLLRLDCAAVDDRFLGRLYAEIIDDRHEKGSYYTPPPMAHTIVRWTLDPLLAGAAPGDRLRIIDPAMGCGDLLLAAAENIAESRQLENPSCPRPELRWGSLELLHGIDRDPVAVEIAAISFWLWAGLPGTSPEF
jgi:hypothetical protein